MTENILIATWNVGVISLLFASQHVDLSVRDTVIFAAVISVIGGIAAACREIQKDDDKALHVLKYALNTGVMGAAVALICAEQTLVPRVVVLGVIGVLSLGGLGTVDAVLRKVKRKAKLDDEHEDE